MSLDKVNFILLIDDDPINNFLNLRLLDSLNLADEVKVCLNGMEALEFLNGLQTKNNHYPDLILLDINMPVLDGFEFLKAFNDLEMPEKDSVKIVMLTTSSALSDLNKIHNLGYEVINKPLTEEKINNILKH
ncbi:MAG: response regulator [Bacteroidota bacterium]|jgi:CheY-like chemotaxis protein|nr:response regulator [Bacteroidota bacterium]